MKLVTWNTQWCCGLDGVVSAQRIVAGARALADFDVLCLQEVAQGYRALPGAPGDQPAQLAALLPGYQLFFGAAVDEFAADGTRQRFGNLVATRLPVAQVQHHSLPWPADAGVPSMPRMCTVLTLQDPRLGALRVMTTHLEYYSKRQRMAQAQALCALHAQASALAAAPPADGDAGSPFQAKTHTTQAILCGDFNLEASAPEYAAITAGGLHDAWRALHGAQPQPATFRLFDRSYGPEPVACDFVFVSAGLLPRLRRMAIDGQTRASDHQPVLVELG
ncbi:MAG TPA: endonuclease/exonuclease/phosphatase family protein [Rubrivivax sp.]|nr:endonuclease/exonuclease/phosphatase family protein [Rubrivivax sp.]